MLVPVPFAQLVVEVELRTKVRMPCAFLVFLHSSVLKTTWFFSMDMLLWAF